MVLTFLPFLSLLILPLPCAVTVLSAQVLPSMMADATEPSLPTRLLFHFLRGGLLIAAMLGAGLMRRGPKLYYCPPSMAKGNGPKDYASVKVDISKPFWKGSNSAWPSTDGGRGAKACNAVGDKDPEPNVLDYDSCSVLSFAFVGYVSPAG
jgi:hypothetical protein